MNFFLQHFILLTLSYVASVSFGLFCLFVICFCLFDQVVVVVVVVVFVLPPMFFADPTSEQSNAGKLFLFTTLRG